MSENKAELVFSCNLSAPSLYHVALEEKIWHTFKGAKGFKKIVYEKCGKKKNIILSARSHPIEQMEKLRLIKVCSE